jgi:cytochrome c553
MMLRHVLLVGAGLLPLPLAVSMADAQTAARQPDPKRGGVIVAQGTPSGAPPCAQCHAFNGASDSSGAFPRIAGQSAQYLAKQLRDFASGVRSNALMSPVAKALSPDDIADVTAYFASLNPPFPPLKPAGPDLVNRGQQLARVGDAQRRIQSCNNCHGPDGAGLPPTVPYLAGQYASYIAFQIEMWQRGYRKNSSEEMANVAKLLDAADIAAVAAFYQQVRSPGARSGK